MSRPWVDFINIDEQELQSCSNEYGTYKFRKFANGTTKNDGRHSPIVGPGRSIMLELDGSTSILAHEAPVMIRVYVFEGSVTFDGKEIKERTYIEITAGSQVPIISSVGKARVFISYDGEYVITSATGKKNEIVIKYMQDLVWRSPVVSDFPGGAARKAFYDHDEFGSAILGILPEWESPFYEWHTFSEEILVVEGSIISSFGTMNRGAYLSHPGGEDTVHGPMYSKEGCLMLVLREGPVGNTFTPAEPAEVASRRD
jgi:hypothetical protein